MTAEPRSLRAFRYPAWLMYVEEELNALGDVLEMNAEDPWHAEVHGLVVRAWAQLRDVRQDAIEAARAE